MVWLLLGILGVTVALGAVGAVYVRQHWVDILASVAAADDSGTPGHYPKKGAKEFVGGCVNGAKEMKDRAEPYCQCFVDEAQAVIPYKEFVRLTLRMAVDDKVPPEFQPMMNTCAQRVLGVPPGEERVETQQ